MKLSEAEEVILTEFETQVQAYPDSIPLQAPNRFIVDMGDPPDLFLSVDIGWGPASQITIDLDPLVRYTGQLEFMVSVREGGGTRVASDLIEYLVEAFQMRAFTHVTYELAVVFQAALLQGRQTVDGRNYHAAAIPFTTDEILART